LLPILFFTLTSAAQSLKLNGRVLNQKNEPISGASVTVSGKVVAADVEGRFSILLEASKKYTLTVSAVGYQTKSVDEIEVKANDANVFDIVLEVSAKQGAANALISYQKNTNTVSSVISAESIRRSPDRNTGEVLKRTTGASVQEGKFIIIRGLADRYNQAMLNGVLLTSTEPDRKTFSFDLIPASMIDNIIINKAFVPEYPGEWAGGLIQRLVLELIHKQLVRNFIKTRVVKQTGWELMMEQDHCPAATQEKQSLIY